MNQTAEAPTRLVLFELGALVCGLLLLMVGVSRNQPELVLVAGPLFVCIGALSLLDRRLALAGPAGSIRRAALGRGGVLRLQLRAWLWIVLGVAVTSWGLIQLREEPQPTPHAAELSPTGSPR